MRNTRDTKRGFTLVEVLVVMVILAILASAVVPSMAGYIDKAKNNSILTQARAVYVAAQSAISEYSLSAPNEERLDQIISSEETKDPDGTINELMLVFLGDSFKESNFKGRYRFQVVDNQVTVVEYTTEDGMTITIPEGETIDNQ